MRVIGRAVVGVGFAGVTVLLLLWLAGFFHEKVGDARAVADARHAGRSSAGLELVAAERIAVPQIETAVGTIEAVRSSEVASKILAKVEAVNVRAGQPVAAGEVLLRLDDADLLARERQAEAQLRGAETRHAQAEVEFERVRTLYEQAVAAKIEFDRAKTALESAAAELEHARQALREAETVLEYAVIDSPFDAVVIDKRVDVGDTVAPGQVLLTLYDPEHMQLVARVRETLTKHLAVEQPIDVRVEALGMTCTGRVSEIVPEAESASRSFSVKVTGPCPDGVYSGMFGRLLIPLGTEEWLVIPAAAVRRVGQLTLVDVERDAKLERRAVQLGRTRDDVVEVLSGLEAGERVALPSEAGR